MQTDCVDQRSHPFHKWCTKSTVQCG